MLVKKIAPFIPDSSKLDLCGVFREWLLQALMLYFKQATSSSFAPFNGYFSSPRDFAQSFAAFVDGEFRGTNAESGRLERTAVLGLQNMIQYAIDNAEEQPGYRDTDPPRLNSFVFELFECLLGLNSEDAFAWAARAIRAHSGFAAMLGPNGSPAALELYFSVVSDDISGPERAHFLAALLDWCNSNAERPEVPPVVRHLLPSVLRSIGGKDRAERQIELITRVCSPCFGRLGLIERFETLVMEGRERYRQNQFDEEVDAIRHAVDSAVPTLVRKLDKKTKDQWRRSYLLFDAFESELKDNPSEGVSDFEMTRAAPISITNGSMLEEIGLRENEIRAVMAL